MINYKSFDLGASDYVDIGFIYRSGEDIRYYCPICAELLDGEEEQYD